MFHFGNRNRLGGWFGGGYGKLGCPFIRSTMGHRSPSGRAGCSFLGQMHAGASGAGCPFLGGMKGSGCGSGCPFLGQMQGGGSGAGCPFLGQMKGSGCGSGCPFLGQMQGGGSGAGCPFLGRMKGSGSGSGCPFLGQMQGGGSGAGCPFLGHYKGSGSVADCPFLGHMQGSSAADCPFLAEKRGGGSWARVLGRFGGTSQCNWVKGKENDFHVTMHVKQYSTDELEVKVWGNDVIVNGKHDASSGESGDSSTGSRARKFTRTCPLREDMDPDTVTSSLSADRVLTIMVKKRVPEGNPRVVDIEEADGDDSD